jgi:hypothetical protein
MRKVIHMLDNASTLLASESPKSDTASRLSGLLAGSLLVVIGLYLCLIVFNINPKTTDSVYALTYKPYVSAKEYAAQKIQSNDQWVCLSQLYGKESGWDSTAVGNLGGNALVYGIPQLKNPIMIGLDEHSQIDYGLKYIKHRYGVDNYGYTNACKAWQHFQIKGWH